MDTKTPKKHNLYKIIAIFLFVTTLLGISGTGFFYVQLNGYKNEVETTDISTRAEVKKLIEKNYIKDLPSDTDYQKGELRGLVSALKDPYSEYLPKAEGQEFADALNQRYEGIGVRFNDGENGIIVDKVFRGSPAEKAGVLETDILKKVGDEETTGKLASQVVEKIRGPKGSDITLQFERESKLLDIKITRDKVATDLIYISYKDNTAIIEISSFGEKLNSKMLEITKQIQAKSEIKNIVIDLRGNSGGLLNEAIEVISYFVKPDEVLVVEKDKKSQKTEKSIAKNPNLMNYKLAVLIDNGSASASEIMAGALKDILGVKLIGAKSYGKGVVQRLYSLDNGDELKLTIAEWLTPNKTEINLKGLQPDIVVDKSKNALDVAIEEFKK